MFNFSSFQENINLFKNDILVIDNIQCCLYGKGQDIFKYNFGFSWQNFLGN